MRGPLAEATAPAGRAESDLLAPMDRRVLVVAGAAFAVLMALSGLYGFHRDELYFLDAARHLQGGYVDQPILTPLLARVSLSLFGVSLPGLRLWPALAVAGTVVVGGLLARELGGGPRAQLVAAIGTATMPAVLGAGHLMGPTTFDILAWATLALVVVRIGRTGDLRLWLTAGLVLGLGLANKHSVGFFAVAFFVGALLSGGWRLVLNRWFLAGAAIAACFTIPDIWWQATHGWATIAMTRSLNRENGGLGNIPNWIIGQLIMVSLALVLVALGTSIVARPRVGLWAVVRVLRSYHGGKDLLPRRGLCVPLGRWSGVHRVAGSGPRVASAPHDLDGGQHRSRFATRAACPSGQVHRLDLQDQRGAGRGRWLARAGSLRGHGVAWPTRCPARSCGHLHCQLRRGRRYQRARAE